MIVMCVLVTGTPPTSRQKPAAVKVKHCPSAFTLRHLARIVVRIKWCKVGDNNYFLLQRTAMQIHIAKPKSAISKMCIVH